MKKSVQITPTIQTQFQGKLKKNVYGGGGGGYQQQLNHPQKANFVGFNLKLVIRYANSPWFSPLLVDRLEGIHTGCLKCLDIFQLFSTLSCELV